MPEKSFVALPSLDRRTPAHKQKSFNLPMSIHEAFEYPDRADLKMHFDISSEFISPCASASQS
jgi:hypothetical protein